MISVVRDMTIYESYIEIILFGLLVGGIILSFIIRAYWLSFYFFILALFYNPLFLIVHHMTNYPVADICVGLSFFMIGLHWPSFVHDVS